MIGCETCGRTDGDILDSRFGSLCYLCFQDAANGEDPPNVVQSPVRARLKARDTWRDPAANGSDAEPQERSSWEPVDLTPILEGGADPEPPPKMLARSDGEFLLYGAKVHLFAGEP